MTRQSSKVGSDAQVEIFYAVRTQGGTAVDEGAGRWFLAGKLHGWSELSARRSEKASRRWGPGTASPAAVPDYLQQTKQEKVARTSGSHPPGRRPLMLGAWYEGRSLLVIALPKRLADCYCHTSSLFLSGIQQLSSANVENFLPGFGFVECEGMSASILQKRL
jgi:hypothetical protein